MLRSPRLLAAVAAAAATTLAYGCTAQPVACTEIGSPAGVSVTVDRAAVEDGMSLRLRICQADCVEQAVDLEPGSVSVGAPCATDGPDRSCSASSSPDGTLVGFVDVATLSAGPVRISGELTTPARTTRLAETTTTAAATYPNGPDCPAGGPQAAVTVTTSGLR